MSLSILPDLEVYYNSQSISNLIPMSVSTSKYCVTMDSRIEYLIGVQLENNQENKFARFMYVIYYYDTDNTIPM